MELGGEILGRCVAPGEDAEHSGSRYAEANRPLFWGAR